MAADVKNPLGFGMFKLRHQNTHQEDSRMRETRNAQASILDFYAPHAFGDQLSMLSDLLDAHPLILDCVESDFRVPDTAATGASGLSVESVFRCLLLKQILRSAARSWHSTCQIRPPTARLHECK